MLSPQVERYLALRQSLGFQLRNTSALLRAFAKFAEMRGDTHVRSATAMDWATAAPSPWARHIQLRTVIQLARFLRVEDARHEIPPNPFALPKSRPLPYIYTPEEIGRLIDAASRLRPTYPLRRQGYATLIGLLASTGLRLSEALDLRLSDVLPEGVLWIRRTKFGKSRLVPLHRTVITALNDYLEARRQLAVVDDHVFLSAGGRRIHSTMASYTFRRIRQLAGVTPERVRPPRFHDLRHTFATRALAQCPTGRGEPVARHFVALATYLGHAEIANTYWYLEATPELMTNLAQAAETRFGGEDL